MGADGGYRLYRLSEVRAHLPELWAAVQMVLDYSPLRAALDEETWT